MSDESIQQKGLPARCRSGKTDAQQYLPPGVKSLREIYDAIPRFGEPNWEEKARQTNVEMSKLMDSISFDRDSDK